MNIQFFTQQLREEVDQNWLEIYVSKDALTSFRFWYPEERI